MFLPSTVSSLPLLYFFLHSIIISYVICLTVQLSTLEYVGRCVGKKGGSKGGKDGETRRKKIKMGKPNLRGNSTS